MPALVDVCVNQSTLEARLDRHERRHAFGAEADFGRRGVVAVVAATATVIATAVVAATIVARTFFARPLFTGTFLAGALFALACRTWRFDGRRGFDRRFDRRFGDFRSFGDDGLGGSTALAATAATARATGRAVAGFGAALLGAIVVSIVSAAINGALTTG